MMMMMMMMKGLVAVQEDSEVGEGSQNASSVETSSRRTKPSCLCQYNPPKFKRK